jgi:excinuclease ABC subunit C
LLRGIIEAGMILTETVAAKLRELPAEPGVYQMKDKKGRIIYVGKALSLKNRVPSYFTTAAESDPRIAYLVREIADLDWVVVPSELDALMLESSLVRQFMPYYNTSLKDDKSYPYVKITVNEPYPRVMLTRRCLNDKARYWGPMTNVLQVRAAVKFIAGLFQIRTCKVELDGKKFIQKPCLDYHLKLCSAPCVDYIKREDYRKLVKFAVDFFNGRYSKVQEELKRRMAESAANREYENAARYRDLLAAVERSFERTRVIGKPGEDLDVLGVAHSQGKACVLLMPVRDGRLVGDQKFVLNARLEESAPGELLAGFIKLHYANPQNIPPELVLPEEPQDSALLAQWLGGLRARAESEDDGSAPVPGRTLNSGQGRPPSPILLTTAPRSWRAALLEIATRNAQERLHTVLLGNDEEFVITPGQRALAQHLGLPSVPRRIEGYDIANLQGKQATGAMVVNIGGRKAPREYRLFNIRLKDTPDDYAMHRETLSRRLTRLLSDPKWDEEVDLIMIDGGKGQLSCAREVLESMLADPRWDTEQHARLARIRLCSLAKQEELVYCYAEESYVGAGPCPARVGEDESAHPRAGHGPAPTNHKPIELRLSHDDPGLRLLVGLRNEAHRYGNAQHAKLRDAAMRISVLDTVPGVGPARRKALLTHFGSVKKLREATEEELAAAPGVGEKLAAQLRRYLDRDEGLEAGKTEMKREMRIRLVKRHKEAE